MNYAILGTQTIITKMHNTQHSLTVARMEMKHCMHVYYIISMTISYMFVNINKHFPILFL